MKKYVRIIINAIGLFVLFSGIFIFELKYWNTCKIDILLYESNDYLPLLIGAVLLLIFNIICERRNKHNDCKKKKDGKP